MRTRLLLFFFLAVIMIASCNDGSDTNDETAKTDTMAGHDTSHAIPATVGAPAGVPEIPAGAKVYFKNLKDGETIKSPYKVKMAVDAMAVDTANGIIKPASGHHHILVDLPESIPHGVVIKMDSVHLHFGKAQTEAELVLKPGKHKLTLQFADALHRSYGDKLSSTITVNVKN